VTIWVVMRVVPLEIKIKGASASVCIQVSSKKTYTAPQGKIARGARRGSQYYKGFLLAGTGETAQLAKSQGAQRTNAPLKTEVRSAGEVRER
jgi:hypothetical protein